MADVLTNNINKPNWWEKKRYTALLGSAVISFLLYYSFDIKLPPSNSHVFGQALARGGLPLNEKLSAYKPGLSESLYMLIQRTEDQIDQGNPVSRAIQNGINDMRDPEYISNRKLIDEYKTKLIDPDTGEFDSLRHLQIIYDDIADLDGDDLIVRVLFDQIQHQLGYHLSIESLDLWALYLGLDQQFGTFEASSNHPTNSNEQANYIQYKAFEGNFDQFLIHSNIYDFRVFQRFLYEHQAINFDLGTFVLDIGRDDKGLYVSAYDKWDFHAVPDNFPVGEPLEFYQRWYVEEVNEETQNSIVKQLGLSSYVEFLTTMESVYNNSQVIELFIDAILKDSVSNDTNSIITKSRIEIYQDTEEGWSIYLYTDRYEESEINMIEANINQYKADSQGLEINFIKESNLIKIKLRKTH